MADQQKLLEVLAAVELDEAHWDPAYWAFQPEDTTCGTTYCTAGHTVKLAYPDAVFEFAETKAWLGPNHPDKMGYHCATVRLPDGTRRSIDTLAQEILQLTDAQANRLFYYGVSVPNGEEDSTYDDMSHTFTWDPEVDGEVSVDGLREVIKGLIDENV